MNRRVEATPPECALAAEMFDHFCSAGTMKQILALHREICNTLNLKPNRLPDFYPKLKEKLARSWKAQALFKKFDLRANHKVYGKGRACTQNKVLIIGAGPCGLRAAIECQLLGAKVVVIEKRDRMSRNNVLHLWPFVIQDLRALGAKKFFGKFCAGSIDHISIRQLQCILLKVSLLLGVEFHEGVSFEELLEPTVTENNESVGWRARVLPSNHPVSMYEFDALVGADGKRNTLHGFKRKEFRGKLAMAITANFINRHSEQEASVPEISGVAFIFNQKFFKELYEVTGIDLENIVYYKDDTHYFVMTAKKHSLLDKGVLLNDYTEVSRLLSVENVDRAALMRYAQEAARFSTGGRLPLRDFALNHYGEPDVALFDFTSMYAAENASIVHERHGRRVLCQLVGDSLLEPFWPTGSGCARGFLSALDAAWAVRAWGHSPTPHPLHVIAERESIYRLLAQTTPENLHRDLGAYTLDPCTRYPNLNRAAVSPHRVTGFYDADEPLPLDAASTQRKRRRAETDVPDEVLAAWVGVSELRAAASPPALAAAVRRYRPDLLPHAAPPTHVYHVLHQELGIPLPASINGGGSVREVPEGKVRSYLSRVYAAFKGEVPHIHHASDVFHQLKQQTDRHLNNDHSISAYSNAAETDKSHSSYKRKRRARAEEGRIVGGGGRTSGSGGARVARLAAELAGQPAPAPPPPRPSKPKDLMRSVGKIERDDWNMREIERKIMENRLGRPEPRAAEKVPKWDREQFLGRQRKLKEGDGSDEKWGEIDETLHKFDQKLRDSGRPDHGTKKVANLATKFVKKDPDPEPVKIQTHKEEVKKSWRGPMTAGVQCASCGTRVFAAEGVTADGLTLHRACFRCAVCRAMLRPGNYTMERYGSRLVCLRHGGIAPGASVPDAAPIAAPPPPTPERISLELSDSGAREIDEDEWTDRNCLASETSAANNVSDEEDSSSDEYTDAGESDAAPARSPSPQRIPTHAHNDIYFSDDSFGYDDYSDDGGESSGGESCSRMRALREARRREVPAEARPPTDSSEVESEEESSSEEESASSATEVSTDSEFARDEGHLPAILVTPAPPPSVVVVPAVAPPVPREYPLSRALSAGGLATQRALELKRRYLLGEPSPPAVRKSDSTSQIDSKLAAFTNNITEFQKMLNPAAAPAPTPTVATAYHAKIDPKPMPDIIKNLCGAAPLDLLAKTEPSLIHDYISERSEPGSESARLEPEDDDGLESDSLSERTERESSRAPVPRLEVHDDSGELVQLDSLTSGAGTAPTVLPASTPVAAGEEGSSSSREASTLALTESSASSWAGEGSALEAAGVGRRAAPRHLARPKPIQAAADHVCGRSDRDTDPSDAVRFENASDHFAFADEGEGEPEPTQVVNRGYMELVDDEYSPTRDRSMDFIERAFSETVYRQTPPASLPAPAPEIVHTLPPDLDNEQISPTRTETESSDKTVAESESRSRGETSSVGLEPSFESLSLSSVTSPPLASPSDASGEAEAARMERVRRERDHQTEVVRRLVLARLGTERAPRRRPRPPAHPTAPPPVPPPPAQAPPSPAPVTPAFSDPELARASPRRNTIMRTISVYINRHLHPRHKWASEPNLSTHQEPVSRVNVAHKSTGALQEVPQEAPPVPPPPAGYCPPPEKTCYRPVTSSKIPAEQQAAKVAELVQVLATRDAHQALMNSELMRRSAPSGGEIISVPLPAGSSLHEARSVRPTHDK